ncbi:MAG TPA: class I SAM-dependent methyltransferase [Gaiellaceae bacterium]|jgi:hypothetical protein
MAVVGMETSLRSHLRGLPRALGVRRLLKALAARAGFDLIKRHYYSPIPDLQAIPSSFWSERSDLVGLQIDADAQLAFVQRELSAYLPEFSRSKRDAGQFYLDNGTYGPGDAELLFAVVRRFAPGHVIEVGSGFSSLVLGEALAANDRDGKRSVYEIVDPHPASASREIGGIAALERIATVRTVSVTAVPLSVFEQLAAGDVLFVDSTHAVVLAGDVTYLVLEVLPRLASGVLVHFHDVFLPWHYPRAFVEREFFWSEQYLLQAFLAFNDDFEILVAANLLARERTAQFAALVPSLDLVAPPSGFWLRRR